MRCLALVLVALLAPLTGAATAAVPAEDLPVCSIHRATGPVVVDGRVDEPAWERAEALEFVFPWDQVTAATAQSTTARMLWDDANLYISYVCRDPYLDAEVVDHDGPVYEEDAVEIFLTPNAADVATYFGFEMNIRGVVLDYMAFGGGVERTPHIMPSWDSEGTRIATTFAGTLNDHTDTDEGWALEVAIPLDNLRHVGGRIPPQPGDEWRLNLNRTAGYRGQFSQWSSSRTERPDFHRALRFGRAIIR